MIRCIKVILASLALGFFPIVALAGPCDQCQNPVETYRHTQWGCGVCGPWYNPSRDRYHYSYEEIHYSCDYGYTCTKIEYLEGPCGYCPV